MKFSDFSIVIPVRNRQHLIGRCLDSVRQQTLRPLKVIVADNGSSDDTLQAVKKWIEENEEQELQVSIVEEPRPGATHARNRGFAEVDTPYVLFFDSDDTMHPQLAELAAKAFSENPTADLVHWRSQLILPDGRRKLRKFNDSDYWRYHIYHALFSTQCFAVRTDYFKKIGAWDNSILAWDDWELGVRLLLGNPAMVPINKVLANIFPQKESITGENFHSKQGLWEDALDTAEMRVMESGRSDALWIADMINYRRANLAAFYKKEGYKNLALPLLNKALRHETITPLRRMLLRLLYHYTALGGRGAYLFWR